MIGCSPIERAVQVDYDGLGQSITDEMGPPTPADVIAASDRPGAATAIMEQVKKWGEAAWGTIQDAATQAKIAQAAKLQQEAARKQQQAETMKKILPWAIGGAAALFLFTQMK